MAYESLVFFRKENESFDIDFDDQGHVIVGNPLDTMLYIALLTDARASADQIKEKDQQRGWFGNLYNTNQDRMLGSIVWLFSQSRNTNDTANSIKDKMQKSLNFLIEDGFVKTIEITTENKENKIFFTINVKINNSLKNEYIIPIEA